MSDEVRWDVPPGVEVAVISTRVIQGRRVPTAITVTCENGVDGEVLRKIPLGRIEALLNVDPSLRDRYLELIQRRHELETENMQLKETAERNVDALCRLPIPAGGKYADDFYQRVALAWQLLAGQGEPPAKRLAAANKVPESTTNRWAKEARRRGLLPPARRKGKAQEPTKPSTVLTRETKAESTPRRHP